MIPWRYWVHRSSDMLAEGFVRLKRWEKAGPTERQVACLLVGVKAFLTKLLLAGEDRC